MAKVIKYKFLSAEVNRGTDDKPNIEQIFINKTMGCNAANEEIAKRESYNGEYTIEDDGLPSVETRTTEERVTDLEEALNMILSGVTE